jgi:hypothetical protein
MSATALPPFNPVLWLHADHGVHVSNALNGGTVSSWQNWAFLATNVWSPQNRFGSPSPNLPALHYEVAASTARRFLHFNGTQRQFLTANDRSVGGTAVTEVVVLRLTAPVPASTTNSQSVNPPSTIVGDQTFQMFNAFGLRGDASGSGIPRYTWATDPIKDPNNPNIILVPGGWHSLDSDASIPLNTLAMIAVTHNAGLGSAANPSVVSLYSNGQLRVSDPRGMNVDLPTLLKSNAAAQPHALGVTSIGAGAQTPTTPQNNFATSGDPFTGDIFEVLVYGKALSASEMWTLYNDYLRSIWALP